MPRITPVCWKTLECVFIKAGFELKRHDGTSHRAYRKKGVKRSIIIPTYPELDIEIIRGNLRSAGITREQYFEYLKECK